MPPAEFHTYMRKLMAASRQADAKATHAQREAGNAKVGKLWVHGVEISIEYPKGAVRRGKRKDGTEWSRVVSNPYGYINKTKSNDGEHLDVWIGDHIGSQLVFAFEFLTARGDHDEFKAVVGARNLAEAKKVIAGNYPPGFIESNVGEIRGYFFPDFKKWMKTEGIMKKSAKHREPRADAKDPADRENCPSCETPMERGDDGFCNRCGEPWPAITKKS